MTIIERICTMLDERGMKKKAAYEAVGVNASTFSSWITANVEGIPSNYIPQLAQVLDISCDELLTGRPTLKLDDDETHLLETYRNLDWCGRTKVLAAAVEEKRLAEAQRVNEDGQP